ncbi:AAA family ATPase [Falsibacillus albus]|uniref:Nuclease SbcCD subunit C n=1 Tax=Falsibacillus albus TaxID=2478915 RepID=A0A3L7JRR6_9BACI|nr:AAA family ATPase [Falsibacillus albus]RLQ93366.1 SMC family ATPase [Falsibacillus albus]
MRPMKLTMQAFGPYAGAETIDFTELGNRKMFVISGKTGAGKTTIFDGISFSIYGRASGEDRSGADLRSQFAEDSMLTETSLLFSLRNETYFIKRSPQQEKKKERGEGFTTVGAKAELYIIDGDGNQKLLGANVREVDEKIKEIIQLDFNQFRQILMIPQGEFRKLLVSDSKDKELILQRLFHTEFYKKIEDKLKEEAGELKKIVERQVIERTNKLRQIHVEGNEDLKSAIALETPNDQMILTILFDVIEAMEQKMAELHEQVDVQQKERDAWQKKLIEAESVLRQFRSKKELEDRKQELDSHKEIFEEKKKAITKAYKAALLHQQEELCHRLRREWDDAKENLQMIIKKKEGLSTHLKQAEKVFEEEINKDEVRKKTAEEINLLANIKNDVFAFESLNKQTAQLQLKQQEMAKQMYKNNDILEKNEAFKKELQEKKKHLEKAKYEKLELERSEEKIKMQLLQLDKLSVLFEKDSQAKEQLNKQNKLLEQVKERLMDAKSGYEAIDQKWRTGQAGILAHQLVQGEACPVCGSEQHPLPAIMNQELPSEQDLKSAKEAVSKLEEERAQIETTLYEAKSRAEMIQLQVLELENEIKESIPNFQAEFLDAHRNGIASNYEDLKQKIHYLQDVLSHEEELEKMVSSNDAERLEVEGSQKELERESNQINERFIEKRTELHRMKSSIPEELRSTSQYEDRWTKVNDRLKKMEKALEDARSSFQQLKEQYSGMHSRHEQMLGLVNKADENLKAERESFKTMMENQGFASYQEYSESKMSEKGIQSLEEEVKNFGEELRSVTDRFHELSQSLKEVDPPDMEKLQLKMKEITSILQEKLDAHTNIVIRIRDNKAILKDVQQINESIKDAEQRYQLIGHLSDMARGQNTYRITFERFVLASFLDEILRIANERLSKMTSGRYQLLRKTDRSKGNVQSGLELLIFDQYTGQERHVKTLSGGESFKASLSLALGLAEVVQQHAGGVSLETMFIDEGFGTLDPESLDNAIEALMDIQSSGRLVGVISHVPELKERIDARLEVISSQNGSRTEFVFL